VHQGQWHNHSRDAVLGWSLTVTVATGRLIIAVVSVLITVVGGFGWSILAFALHKCRIPRQDTNDPDPDKDALYYQQQAELRNSQTAASSLSQLLSLWLVWKSFSFRDIFRKASWRERSQLLGRRPRRAENVTGRTCALLIPTLVLLSAFFAAAILSSQIAEPTFKSSDVLVARGRCGLWNINGSTEAERAIYDRKVLNDTLGGRAYARSCYSTDLSSINPVSCSFYTKRNLTYATTSTQCPFPQVPNGTKLCDFNGNSDAHLMFTLLLDSHEDLGINAANSDGVQLQKNVTCSPINVNNYTSHFSRGNLTYQQFNLGPVSGVSDYTFLLNEAASTDGVGPQLT